MNISNALYEFTAQIVAAATVLSGIEDEAAQGNGNGGGFSGGGQVIVLPPINPPANPLAGCHIHADVYEEIKPGKTIRIDDVRQARMSLVPSGAGLAVRRDNAIVSIQFIVMPESQKLRDLLDARETAEQMADAWFIETFENLDLQGKLCAITDVNVFNEWIRPGTVKMPVCVLRLKINPVKTD